MRVNNFHLKSRFNYLVNIINSSRKHLYIKLFLKELKSLNKPDIIKYLRKLRIEKDTDSINFLGSGSSVVKATKILSSKDVIIGGKLTCLLPIYQDIFFTEWCGIGHKTLIPHFQNLYEKRSKYIGFLINNCLSQNHNKIPYSPKYSNTKYYLYEASRAIIDSEDINLFISESLNKRRKFLCQSLSVVFTAISLAYLSGYKEINLFGVDFGGQYFWDTEEFKDLKNKMLLPKNFPRGYKYGSEILYPIRTKTSKHETSTPKYNVEMIIDAFSKNLKKEKFNIINRKYN